jgi:hypothetical protein
MRRRRRREKAVAKMVPGISAFSVNRPVKNSGTLKIAEGRRPNAKSEVSGFLTGRERIELGRCVLSPDKT